MTGSVLERLRATIDADFERTLGDLDRLLRLPTFSDDKVQLDAAAGLLRTWLDDLGFVTQTFALGGAVDPPLVYGRSEHPRAVRTLLIYGHFDVQPVEPLADWVTPPFEPDIRDGTIYARGANDPKGQLVCHFAALRAIASLGLDLPLDLRIVLDPQEEIGSPFLADFVARHVDLFRADLCFMADGESIAGERVQLVFGNRGLLHVVMRCRTAAQDVHSGTYGGVLPNAAWRMMEFLGTLREADGRVAVAGFYDRVRPPGAAERAALAALPYEADRIGKLLGVRGSDLPADGAKYWERIMYRPSCDISGLAAGYGAGPGVKALIPAEAVAKVGFRLVADQAPEEILSLLRQHATRHGFKDIVIEPATVFHPLRIPFDTDLGALVAGAARDGFDEVPLIVPVNPGSNPNHLWSRLAGAPPIELSYCHQGGLAHGANEHMRLDRIRKGILVSALVMLRFAGQVPAA